jgi:transcriptional regulator with XRE-family HTH domain
MANDRRSVSYARIGTGDAVPIPVPIHAEGIGTRIGEAADAIGTRKSAAAAMGVSPDALQRYIRGENMPPLDAAARLCLAAGKSLDWLVSGASQLGTIPAATRAPAINLELLNGAVGLLDDLLEAFGDGISSAVYARHLAEIYDLLISDERAVPGKVVEIARFLANHDKGKTADVSRESREASSLDPGKRSRRERTHR